MTTRSNRSWLRLAAVGTTAVAVLAVSIIVVISWSHPQLLAAAGAPIVETEGPARFAEAQAPAPKQVAPHPKQPPQAQAPKPAQIDRNGVLMLIRSALLALDQANKTGNYTVLRDLGSPGFGANSAAQLADIFAKQRRDNIDLSGVAVLEPQLTVLPQIEANGMMRMAGFFPSVPTQVNFELIYEPVDRQWRLFGISVSVGQNAPAAPPPPGPPPSTALPKGEAPEAQTPTLEAPKASRDDHATPAEAEKATGEAKQ